MLLVYLIGCFLPLLCVYIYMYFATRGALLEQEYKNVTDELDTEVNEIENDMYLAEEFCAKLYYDDEAEKIGIRQYAGNLLFDYKNFDELYDYTKSYYPSVSEVCVYLKDDEHIDNRRFKLITDTIEQKNWYIRTLQNNGMPYWSYITNVQTTKKSLRLTKVLYDKNDRIAGVVSISLAEDIVQTWMETDEVSKLLVFNGTEIVQSNCSLSDEELAGLMKNLQKEKSDRWTEFEGSRCMALCSHINLRYSEEYYDLIIIKPYADIVHPANKSSVGGLVPLMLGTLVATIAFIWLSNWFSKRINAFREAMHEAAAGNFDQSNTEIGDTQDEIWELNNDLNQMIRDTRQLMETAAGERLQKEQLYSRQKDVEFKMLATQINPHFLYNTLENIRMLARINDQPEIEDISVTLTKLLRRSLNVGQELVTVQWEMEMVEYYIRIQNYRFGDRITAEVLYDKDEAAQHMLIPLVIQPFVENAYVHAMEDKEADGRIIVRVEISDELLLYIEDNGHGMSGEKCEEMTKYINDFENLDRTHIGICNVNQRIKLKFGEPYGVDFQSEENAGTKVKITMPLVRRE
jgi:two-component system sensor histidine kinase YesM